MNKSLYEPENGTHSRVVDMLTSQPVIDVDIGPDSQLRCFKNRVQHTSGMRDSNRIANV